METSNNKKSINMKKLLSIFCVAIIVLATSCQEETKGEIKLVTPEEMQKLLEQKDVQLVDVRTPEEYQEGFIANAQNIDFNSPTFDEEVSKLDKTKPVLLYCKGGGRSAKCSEKLLNAGFVKIYDLKGGITQWKFMGFEITPFR
jgi:rhodanese-related sulfurtransferase